MYSALVFWKAAFPRIQIKDQPGVVVPGTGIRHVIDLKVFQKINKHIM